MDHTIGHPSALEIALCNLTGLQKLSIDLLWVCSEDLQEVDDLCVGLLYLTALTSLTFAVRAEQRNPVVGVARYTCERLAEVLVNMHGMVHLDLSGGVLSAAGAEQLTAALHNMPRLQTFRADLECVDNATLCMLDALCATAAQHCKELCLRMDVAYLFLLSVLAEAIPESNAGISFPELAAQAPEQLTYRISKLTALQSLHIMDCRLAASVQSLSSLHVENRPLLDGDALSALSSLTQLHLTSKILTPASSSELKGTGRSPSSVVCHTSAYREVKRM